MTRAPKNLGLDPFQDPALAGIFSAPPLSPHLSSFLIEKEFAKVYQSAQKELTFSRPRRPFRGPLFRGGKAVHIKVWQTLFLSLPVEKGNMPQLLTFNTFSFENIFTIFGFHF